MIGILDDNGHRQASDRGVPQGAVISPVLANIFLHYVFDLWTHQWRKRTMSGDVIVIRYAADAIVGFQYRSGAVRYQRELGERLKQFGLLLHPEKTRLLEFGRFAVKSRRDSGLGKPETFDFLGFTHVCGKSRITGKFLIRLLTMKKRMRAKLCEIKLELRRRLHDPVSETGWWLRSVIKGHLNYYAVAGNGARVSSFICHVSRLWLKSLRRRSQRSRMMWARFNVIAARFLPSPCTVHPYANVRFDAIHPR